MPHLGLETTYDPTPAEMQACSQGLTALYTDMMNTRAEHVAVTIRSHPPTAMALGRATDGPITVLHADIRAGRTLDRRREFALTVIDWLKEHWNVAEQNIKVVFTEHPGNHMMGVDRIGGEWSEDESESAH